MKKYLTLVFAVFLTMGALAGHAEGAAEPGGPADAHPFIALPGDGAMPDPSFSPEEYRKLWDLRTDGYRRMTIAAFRDRIGKLTDNKEYLDLLERFWQSGILDQMKDTDAMASFLFYELPLAGDDWAARTYHGEARSMHAVDAARLEYSYTLTILDADKVMLKDYDDVRLGVKDAMRDLLINLTDEELRDAAGMRAYIQSYVDDLLPDLGSPDVGVEFEFMYYPLTAEAKACASELRGTEEDYRSLLALMTPDCADLSVADFDEALLAWANADYFRMVRIDEDALHGRYPANLRAEERDFISLTVALSGAENGRRVQSIYENAAMADPSYQQILPQKMEATRQGAPLWCDFGYRFSYHIADPEEMTIGERDSCIGGMIRDVEKFWDDATLADLLAMERSDLVSRLKALADAHSRGGLTISIDESQVHLDRAEGDARRP